MGNEIENLTNLLTKITADLAFRPADGPFRSRLVEIVMADADAEFAEFFSESSSDILVTVSCQASIEGVIRFQVVSGQGENSAICVIASLRENELTDLIEQLSRKVEVELSSTSRTPHKVIVRKRSVDGMLDIHQAAQGLGCSESFLKSRIPCTDYSYDEVDGKPVIKEYYWSPQLIDRLCQIKTGGAKAEDLEYVAVESCHGDNKWAEELVVSLTRPIKSKPVDGLIQGGKRPSKNIPRSRTNNRPPRKKNP